MRLEASGPGCLGSRALLVGAACSRDLATKTAAVVAVAIANRSHAPVGAACSRDLATRTVGSVRLVAQDCLDFGLAHRQCQHRMQRKALGEQRHVADLLLAHQHDDLRCRRQLTQAGKKDIKVADVGAGVVVAKAIEELGDYPVWRGALECL